MARKPKVIEEEPIKKTRKPRAKKASSLNSKIEEVKSSEPIFDKEVDEVSWDVQFMVAIVAAVIMFVIFTLFMKPKDIDLSKSPAAFENSYSKTECNNLKLDFSPEGLQKKQLLNCTE